ncbi:MAG: signal recognition particle-docking protein FtsY [Candidatus Thorarchaeota archaeon]
MSTFTKGLKNFVSRVKTKEINEKNVQDTLQEFKIFLLKNNVSSKAVNEIINKTKNKVLGQRIARFSNMEKLINGPVRESILEIVTPRENIDLLEILKQRKEQNITKPLIILFLGINGTGKTTTIAKIAYMMKNANFRVVIAAADTFRAAAQEQIKEHADKLNIKCIEGAYGGDPASVAFDAISHATARNLHIVLIDTAGRMAINHDLIGEMQKIKRNSQPDFTFLVVDALAGNDATSQAKEFDEKIGIDGTIINKIDADEKSGTALSVTTVTKGKPIVYVGTGQKYKDLQKFNPEVFVNRLFSL